MIKANLESLVETCVVGEIGHPSHVGGTGLFSVGYDGHPRIPLIHAGITLNVGLGDYALRPVWGERVMPGVSIRNPDPRANAALNLLTCVGNEAKVIKAHLDGKDTRLRGQSGVVIGKDSGEGLVILAFGKRVLSRLCVGDLIQVRAHGQGLAFPDHPDILVSSCSPALFKGINPSEKGGRVRIPVTTIIPGKLMVPSGNSENGSPLNGCEVQCTSQKAVREYKLQRLRLGDLVAVADLDSTYGPRWHGGAITIGVIAHGASTLSGRGPGITVLFTSADGLIEPVITRKAMLKDLLSIP